MLGPQSMGYDRTSIMYSPEGRLIQVEYARESVRRGSIAVGIKSKNGVVLAGLLRVVDLNEPDAKVHKIDDNVYATFAGVAADGRVLISRARLEAQIFRMTYDLPTDIKGLSTKIGDYCQLYTQQGGVRPFGVGLLIGGVDDTGSSLYYVDPGGGVISVKAKAIGEGDTEAISILKENYKEDLTIEEMETLAKDVIKKIVKDEVDEKDIMVVSIPIQ
ncbi:MAG: archaeal proteasome endopeptidase complex subunit alpha [Candidatus Heimdallarchaeum endolithica]|uniref:Archaeal proteasome endopeptidase complex subunit alpha n=1 Tax=Candidatus Heimdallarchaeum endolithica TaxID=2876572 RepID=A0A9Y1FPZ9_9ARCH|nr:MAG: archaeal proteasome endopeptidase complex subunit alpha [Candidatus Heimdallarchaeum endolithica]